MSQDRPLTSAELQRVADALHDRDWAVTAIALEVLREHDHPDWRSTQSRVLQRAAEFTAERMNSHRSGPAPTFRQWRACIRLVHEILEREVSRNAGTSDSPNDLQATLIAIVSNCRDGGSRARALTLLRRSPPHNWQSIVQQAIDDPSEQVRLVALDIVAEARWETAHTAVEQLASSPRPNLRQRAAEVLAQFGRSVKPAEYGNSVMTAAGQIADQLAQAGVSPADAWSIALGKPSRGATGIDYLNERAEQYLDQSVESDPEVVDHYGILLLAAAAHSSQRKLVIRLWEREVAFLDSDNEFLERALETLARRRLIEGIAAVRSGDEHQGLQSLAAIARLARDAASHSILQDYMKSAGQLSAAVGNAANSAPPSSPEMPAARESAIHLASQILDGLDLSQPQDAAEARRRLDTWIGVRDLKLPDAGLRSYQPVAN
jgi:hypothetical protein